MRLSFVAVVFSLMLIEAHCGFRVQSIKKGKTTFIELKGLAAYYGFSFRRVRTGKELISRGDRNFIFDSKERFMISNRSKVFLQTRPILEKGALYVSKLDYSKLIDPVMRDRIKAKKRRIKTIVLDPGHGGKDHGAQGSHITEKKYALQFSIKLKKNLERLGFTVYLTRYSDRFPSFSARANHVKKFKADLFLSVHVNATVSKKIKGIETFHFTPLGGKSSNGSPVRKKWAKGDTYQKQSARLAYEIHRQLISYTKATDRGAKFANFKVLREASCPSALLELGFLSNKTEEQKLLSKSYQDKLLKGIAYGVYYYSKALK